MWEQPLDKDSYKIFAIRHYRSGVATWNEFFADLKQFSYIIRCISFKKDEVGTVEQNKSILNSIMHLNNTFSGDSLARLFFFISRENPDILGQIKTYLHFIHRLPDEIPELDLSTIDISESLLNLLNQF